MTMSLEDAWTILKGADSATQKGLHNAAYGAFKTVPGIGAKQAARMAGSGVVKNVARFIPGLSVGMAAMDTADILQAKDGAGNAFMDAVGMVGGGIAGIPGGPIGIIAGASGGKGLMDLGQSMLAGGKSREQLQLEEALKRLNGGLVS